MTAINGLTSRLREPSVEGKHLNLLHMRIRCDVTALRRTCLVSELHLYANPQALSISCHRIYLFFKIKNCSIVFLSAVTFFRNARKLFRVVTHISVTHLIKQYSKSATVSIVERRKKAPNIKTRATRMSEKSGVEIVIKCCVYVGITNRIPLLQST